MGLKIDAIDQGNRFDFGKTSVDYAKYRDVYPESLYQKLNLFNIGTKGQHILDIGTGTGAVPRHMYSKEVAFTATDISENQIKEAKRLSKGMDIKYKVCPAEDTGFDENSFDVVIACQCFQYFDLDRFIPELVRILKPEGEFCKIFMDWLPFEDDIVYEMEQLVLKYNPTWSSGGFKSFDYTFPKWAKEHFELETVHSYNEYITFTKEAWKGRVRTCRGVGASLSEEKLKAFDEEYAALLAQYKSDLLHIKHQVHIEIYRLQEDDK